MDQKIKDFWNKLNSDIAELWKNNKLFLIIFGVLILVIKFRTIIINLLIENSKELMKKNKEKDKNLQQQEEDYKKQSEYFLEKAKESSKDKSPIKEDWYKK